jgi:uncharacterized protein YjiS (DUF1127 family)
MGTIWALHAAARIPLENAGALARQLLGTAIPWLRTALGGLGGFAERTRQRQALARLDDRQLKDMGLARHQVERELTKWFWQP